MIYRFRCGYRLRNQQLLPFNALKDVGDNEQGTKLIEILSDSLGVQFVVELGTIEVEKKRQNLKFYGGFKGTIAIIKNNYKNWEKVL